jgi:hypothetical protein
MPTIATASPWTTVRFRRAKDIKAWALLGIPVPLYPIVVQRLFERQARFLAKHHRGRYISLLFEAPADLAAVLATTFAAPPGCEVLSVNETGDRVLFGKAAQSGRARRQSKDNSGLELGDEDDDLAFSYQLAELSQFAVAGDESSLGLPQLNETPLNETPLNETKAEAIAATAPAPAPVSSLPIDDDELGWVEEEEAVSEISDETGDPSVEETEESAEWEPVSEAAKPEYIEPEFEPESAELDSAEPEPAEPEPAEPAPQSRFVRMAVSEPAAFGGQEMDSADREDNAHLTDVWAMADAIECPIPAERSFPASVPMLSFGLTGGELEPQGDEAYGAPIAASSPVHPLQEPLLPLMDHPNHVYVLKQGVEAWNNWRRLNPDVRPSLRGAYLNGLPLCRLDLRDTDLRFAFLFRADLRGADLRGALLIGADLIQANLRSADLRGANLSGAYLSQANLDHANLRGADLRGTFLQGAFFCETVMPSGRSSGEPAIAEDAVVRQAM